MRRYFWFRSSVIFGQGKSACSSARDLILFAQFSSKAAHYPKNGSGSFLAMSAYVRVFFHFATFEVVFGSDHLWRLRFNCDNILSSRRRAPLQLKGTVCKRNEFLF